MELRTKSSENRIDAPAALNFVPSADAALLRDTNVSITTALGSRRERGEWLVTLPQAFTFSVKRALVKSRSLSVSFTPYTTMTPGMSSRPGASVSTWVREGTSELSLTAGVAHEPEGEMWRSLYAYYARRIGRRVRGVSEVTYAGGGPGACSMAASGTMTYEATPGLQLNVSVRHQTMEAFVDSSVRVGVTVHVGG
jgi:hypothetical protein